MAAPLRAGNLNTMEVNSNTTAEIGDDEEYVPISGVKTMNTHMKHFRHQ